MANSYYIFNFPQYNFVYSYCSQKLLIEILNLIFFWAIYDFVYLALGHYSGLNSFIAVHQKVSSLSLRVFFFHYILTISPSRTILQNWPNQIIKCTFIRTTQHQPIVSYICTQTLYHNKYTKKSRRIEWKKNALTKKERNSKILLSFDAHWAIFNNRVDPLSN